MTDPQARLMRDALEFHTRGRPGKIEIIASKPMATQRDLALAFSPGVANNLSLTRLYRPLSHRRKC